MQSKKQRISGWGNAPIIESRVYRPESLPQLQSIVKKEKRILASGLHKSQGDASIGACTIDMTRMNRMLSFDKKQGILEAEAGTTLVEILDLVVPQGWFLGVTPGTKKVTLGGCVASNVHGKNHHRVGGFGSTVRAFTIIDARGRIITCSPKQNKELFLATIGGMGLTGTIYSVEIQLKKISSPFLEVTYKQCGNLDELFAAIEEMDKQFAYTVAWIDCLAKGKHMGRGIVMGGTHTRKKGKVKGKQVATVPFFLPNFTLNKLGIKIFNTLYYAINPSGKKVVHYNPFFYPLDIVEHWNRIYGKRGFIQYQFVLPPRHIEKGFKKILKLVTDSGASSFLSTVKMLHDEPFPLTFPKRGIAFAFDMPITKRTLRLVAQLDALVEKMDGRLYLTKDTFMKPSLFTQSYPRLKEWLAVKKKYDPTGKFVSHLSKRLKITGGRP